MDLNQIIDYLLEHYDGFTNEANDLFEEIISLEAEKETKPQAASVKAALKSCQQNKKDIVKAIELITAVKVRKGKD